MRDSHRGVAFGVTVLAAAAVALAVTASGIFFKPKPLPAPKIEEQLPVAQKGDRAESFREKELPTPVLTPSPEQPPDDPPPRVVRKASGDTCTRHGGWRVEVGRSWHCAYPERRKKPKSTH